MTDRPGWVHKVTQAFARSPQPATQLDERHVRLRTFQRQLGQLRDMAETAHNSLTASYYESVWREMGEELAFLTRDIDTRQLTADDMTAVFEEWQTKGRAHLRHHPEAAQIFQLIDLGGGATLQLPSDRHADAQAARTNANDEALGRRLDDLMGRAEQAEFDAERLDDADRPQAAEQLRENARQLIAQADQLARESGLGSIHANDVDHAADTHGDGQAREDMDQTGDANQADDAAARSEGSTEAISAVPDGELSFTAYPSSPSGWTVWDHTADRPVITDVSEDLACHLVDQLEHDAADSDAQPKANADDAGTNDADDEADDDQWKGPYELFEESMDALYLEHLEASGVDLRAEADDDDPVPEAIRGKGWLGEPLTDADRVAIWRAIGTRQEPPYGDFPASRHEVQAGADAVGSAARDRAGDLAGEAKDAAGAASTSHSAGDSHTDKPEQQADDESDDDTNSATDDRGVSELIRAADATPTDAAEAEPVAATETTACAIAVTRARCAIDRARQQLETAEQEAAAERDDELIRWHDDTAAQQAANDTAALDGAAVHGE